MNANDQAVLDSYGDDLLSSAITSESQHTLEDFFSWYEDRKISNNFSVKQVPLDSIAGWSVNEVTGNLHHNSGKFFSIVGLDVHTNFGTTPRWNQPIINQPEIGILGFIAQKKNGILHFLVQAKMEPGNVNLVQISPTLQATKSNYTSVHGGNKPAYLDYFIDSDKSEVLFDQLQSEQGARFYRKRNRNIIIEVDEHEHIDVQPDFYWLTLAQILDLLMYDNIINMDSRTVLSIIEFNPVRKDIDELCERFNVLDYSRRILESSVHPEEQSYHRFNKVISWLTNLKTIYETETKFIPLNEAADWAMIDGVIRHKNSKYFSVIGVSVEASNREVACWQQPLIESAKGGVIAFICQMKDGVLHFLIQAKVEPGNFDTVELAPTVQYTPHNFSSANSEDLPSFHELVEAAKSGQIKYDHLQSEEGGRFYHDQNRYKMIEIPESASLEVPENYNWMTIRQIKNFIKFNNFFNIEARGLLSCLNYRNMA